MIASWRCSSSSDLVVSVAPVSSAAAPGPEAAAEYVVAAAEDEREVETVGRVGGRGREQVVEQGGRRWRGTREREGKHTARRMGWIHLAAESCPCWLWVHDGRWGVARPCCAYCLLLPPAPS